MPQIYPFATAIAPNVSSPPTIALPIAMVSYTCMVVRGDGLRGGRRGLFVWA